MFQKIMVPVDLQHVEKLEKSIQTAAQIARQHGSEVCFVGISGKVPDRVASTPEKFAAELNMFAREQGDRLEIETSSKAKSSVDVAVEVDEKLLEVAREIEADLIVMASHIPGVADRLHLISSNAGYIVKHSDISVFVVR